MNPTTAALIHYYRDSPEREGNLTAVARWLKMDGIMVMMHEERQLEPDGLIRRTRAINDLCKKTNAEIVAIYDADVILPFEQTWKAIEMIADGIADFVYPYDGSFRRIDMLHSQKFRDTMDIDFLAEAPHTLASAALGGAVFVNRKKYIEVGMENENFISYGPEDSERYHRFKTLGTVKRVEGPLYHLYHPMSDNSRPDHAMFDANMKERRKVESMSAEQLREYIKTWEWTHACS